MIGSFLAAPPPARAVCSFHPSREIEGFCDACVVAICGTCTFDAHKGHKYRSVREVVDEKKSDLVRMLTVLRKHVSSVATGIKEIEQNEVSNVETTTKARLLVQKQAREYRAKIDLAETRALQDLETMSERKRKENLGGQKLDLQFTQIELDNLVAAATEAVACVDFPSLLLIYGSVFARFAALEKKQPSWRLRPCSNGVVNFEPAPIEEANLGSVVDGDCPAASCSVLVTGADKQRTITIVAKNNTGRGMPGQSQNFHVHLQPPKGAGQVLVVTDAGKGNYSATCVLTEEGKHEIGVMIRNVHVAGSPLSFVVNTLVSSVTKPLQRSRWQFHAVIFFSLFLDSSHSCACTFVVVGRNRKRKD